MADYNNWLEYSIVTKEFTMMMEALENKLINLEPEFAENKEFIRAEMYKNLMAQKNPDGSTYRSSYAAIMEGRRTLYKNGDYFRSFEIMPRKDGLDVTSDHAGAPTHELGLPVRIFGRTPPYKFPQRSIAWLSDRAIKMITDNIARGF